MICDSIRNHEHLALLAWTRAEAQKMLERALDVAKRNGLSPTSCSLIKDREKKFTLISETLDTCRADFIHGFPNTGDVFGFIANVLVKHRTQNLPPNAPQTKAIRLILNDTVRNDLGSDNEMLKANMAFRAKTLSGSNWQKILFRRLLHVEAQKNSVDDWLTGASKTNVNPDDFDIVSSTIHSAKGLEFDNVILAYNPDKKGHASQEVLRLFFVGLTRAKNKEIVLSKRTLQCPDSSLEIEDMGTNPMQTAFALARCAALNQAQSSGSSFTLNDDDEEENDWSGLDND